MPSVARVLDYSWKTRVEAVNFGGSIEKQEKKVVLIPYTQPEEIQKATRETRTNSKEAPTKDAVDNTVLVDLVPDSQRITTNRTRTALERKPIKKVSEAYQEKEEDAGLAALTGMHKTIKQQAELI